MAPISSVQSAIEYSGGTILVNSGATLTVSGYLSVQSNATLTVEGSMTVSGEFSVDGDAAITVSGGILTVGSYEPGTGAVQVDNSLTVEAGTFHDNGEFFSGSDTIDITLGTVTIAGPTTLINDDMTISSESIFAINGGTLSNNTIAVAGLFNTGAVSSEFDQFIVVGTWMVAGTLNVENNAADASAGSDTATLTIGADATVSAQAALFTADPTTASSGTFDITDAGTFTIAGDFSASGYTMAVATLDELSEGPPTGAGDPALFTAGGTVTLTGNSYLTVGGEDMFTAQAVALSGSTLTVEGTFGVSGDFGSNADTIDINGGTATVASLTVGGTVALTDDPAFTIGGGDTVTAAAAALSGNTITVNGTFAVSGDFASDADTIGINGGTFDAASITVGGTATLTDDAAFTIYGSDDTFSAGAATLSGNTITSAGTFAIAGDFSSTQDTITINGADQNAAFSVGGTAMLSGDMIYVGNASFTLGAIAETTDTGDLADNNFKINDTGSWIEIGSAQTAESQGLGGDFIIDPGQTYSGGGMINAWGIVINGVLEVQSGDQENIQDFIPTNLAGVGTLAIDGGATAIIPFGGLVGAFSGPAPTIEFDELERGQRTRPAAANAQLEHSGVNDRGI